jgi:predicted anti-sigma-YlaC factor YlaD
LEAGLSTPPPLTPPDPTDELVRIERRRKAAIRQRRHSRLRTLLVVLLLAAAGAGGFFVGQALTEAPGPQLTTSDRGLARVTVTETVAARTITVVTRGTP